LPVIASPKPEQSVAQWIEQVQAQNLALREHEHTALYEVQRWAGLGGEALFDNILVFENYPISEALQQGAPDGLKFGAVTSQEQTNYPLTLAVGLGDVLSVHYGYDREYFSTLGIQRISEHFCNLLKALAERSQQSLGKLPLLSPEEQQQIVYDWNRTEAQYPSDQCIHQLIEAQAEKTPDAVAVIFGDQELTYQELNRKANQLAHKLRELGVGPDVLVGIAVERSLEMVIGLLAILKAGGAYVPLDLEYPQDRLEYMIEDSGIQLLLTQAHLQDQLPIPGHVQYLNLDQGSEWQIYSKANSVNLTQPENLAYVIYTSGSTGLPKGVGIPVSSAIARLSWMQAEYSLNENSVFLQKAPLGFDVSVWECFLPFICGGRLIVSQPGDHKDPERLAELIQQHSVSVVHFVPPLLELFAEVENVGHCTSLENLFSGGEVLSARLCEKVKECLPDTVLHNRYGPTETTINATHWCYRNTNGAQPPIGIPLSNTTCQLLGSTLDVAAIGVAAELLVGGEGLARGYLQRPALTAERFIPNPFNCSGEGGGRLYRTCDLARYRVDGVIEYVGRVDYQVKIRGFRIELGEIEARLQEHKAIREVVVIDIEGASGKQLVAYLVTEVSQQSDVEQQATLRAILRDHLKESLPDYMVPAHLVFLDKLPLMPNGKLDRKALPKPDASQLQQGYIAPQSELEQQIAAIWANVLQLEKVGLSDNFFELGGHSLLVISVVSRLQMTLGLKTEPSILFKYPILHDFASMLDGQAASAFEEKLRRLDLFSEELETFE
ncbi:non-ribosomal peptide synthetase, partial [Stutzerimonas kirkiae]|uniref:non-ribosomal peptide synthetase n=1 Tax=Stutzerimonas kirkiae TaxID=2211392 RepID=UPI0010383658